MAYALEERASREDGERLDLGDLLLFQLGGGERRTDKDALGGAPDAVNGGAGTNSDLGRAIGPAQPLEGPLALRHQPDVARAWAAALSNLAARGRGRGAGSIASARPQAGAGLSPYLKV